MTIGYKEDLGEVKVHRSYLHNGTVNGTNKTYGEENMCSILRY